VTIFDKVTDCEKLPDPRHCGYPRGGQRPLNARDHRDVTDAANEAAAEYFEPVTRYPSA
jgi:hypothetical protein